MWLRSHRLQSSLVKLYQGDINSFKTLAIRSTTKSIEFKGLS